MRVLPPSVSSVRSTSRRRAASSTEGADQGQCGAV